MARASTPRRGRSPSKRKIDTTIDNSSNSNSNSNNSNSYSSSNSSSNSSIHANADNNTNDSNSNAASVSKGSNNSNISSSNRSRKSSRDRVKLSVVVGSEGEDDKLVSSISEIQLLQQQQLIEKEKEKEKEKEREDKKEGKGEEEVESPRTVFRKFLARQEQVDACYHFTYISEGYRSNYELWDAFLSLFEMHNETMNIWSHLIGFFAVLYCGLNYLVPDVNSDLSTTEFIMFQIYIAAASICMLFSTMYHWFSCLSTSAHDALLILDLSGVALLVAGSYLPAVYYGFYCLETAQKIHFILAAFVLVMGLTAPWINIRINGVLIRPYILASLALIGIFPFVHWLVVTPIAAREELAIGYILVFILYGAGFGAWVSKYPEKWFPNNYFITHFIPSHTVWHLCVFAAVFVWFRHIENSRLYFLEHNCSTYNNSTDSFYYYIVDLWEAVRESKGFQRFFYG